MLANHNKNQSSFRIIEPKRFQQAQQIPVKLSSQQIPVLSSSNNLGEDFVVNNSKNLNGSSSSLNFQYSTLGPNTNRILNQNNNNNNNNQIYQGQYSSLQQFNASNSGHQHLQQQQYQPFQNQNHHNHHHSQHRQQHSQQQQQHQPQNHNRTRNLSDTDSSYIPGKTKFFCIPKFSNIYFVLRYF